MDVRQLLVYIDVFAVQKRHFADNLYQFRFACLAQFCNGLQAGFAIQDVDFDFNQLVIPQCAFEVGSNTFSQTIVSHSQNWFQMVANGFVLFLLLLSERHNLTPVSDLVKSGGQFTRASPRPPS